MSVEELELLVKLAESNEQLIDTHWMLVSMMYEMIKKDPDEDGDGSNMTMQ